MLTATDPGKISLLITPGIPRSPRRSLNCDNLGGRKRSSHALTSDVVDLVCD